MSFSYVKTRETYPLPRTRASAYCLSSIKAALFYYTLTNYRKVLSWYSATHHQYATHTGALDTWKWWGLCFSCNWDSPSKSLLGSRSLWVPSCYHHPKIPVLIATLMDTRGQESGLYCPYQSSISISGRALYLSSTDILSMLGTQQWIHACGVTASTSNLLFRCGSWYLERWLAQGHTN